MSRRRKGNLDALVELAGGSLTDLSAEQFLQKLRTGWRPGGDTHMPGTVLGWFQDEREERIAAQMPQLQIERHPSGRLTEESGYAVMKAVAGGQVSPQIIREAEKAAMAATARHFVISTERVGQIVRKAERTWITFQQAVRKRTRKAQESEQKRTQLMEVVKRAARRLNDPFYRGLGPLDEIAELAAGKTLDPDSLHRVITVLAKAFLKADAQDPKRN